MNRAQWSYKREGEWIKLGQEANKKVENEYQTHLTGTREGCLVFHCFGDRLPTCINYEKMNSYCSSAKCFLSHKERGLDNSHNVFDLEREMIYGDTISEDTEYSYSFSCTSDEENNESVSLLK